MNAMKHDVMVPRYQRQLISDANVLNTRSSQTRNGLSCDNLFLAPVVGQQHLVQGTEGTRSRPRYVAVCK